MPKSCTVCGAPIGGFRALLGRDTCAECDRRRRTEQREQEAEERTRRDEARERRKVLLARVGTPGTDLAALVDELTQTTGLVQLGDDDKTKKQHGEAFRRCAEVVLADDILSAEEEAQLFQLGDALGVDGNAIQTDFRDIRYRLAVASVNDGRLPVLDAPNILTKRGEVVHAEMKAELMKEVTLREYRGGYSGFSLRITKGVRYHVGATRGKSVVVGSEIQAEDTGFLFSYFAAGRVRRQT